MLQSLCHKGRQVLLISGAVAMTLQRRQATYLLILSALQERRRSLWGGQRLYT